MAATAMEIKENAQEDQAQMDNIKSRVTPVFKECSEMEEPLKGTERNQAPGAMKTKGW